LLFELENRWFDFVALRGSGNGQGEQQQGSEQSLFHLISVV
jgi:hypothetical protein